MKKHDDKFPKKGIITRGAILSMALSGVMTLEAANVMLSQINPNDAPITQEEFQTAQSNSSSQSLSSPNSQVLIDGANSESQNSEKGNKPNDSKSKPTYTVISTDIKDDGSIVAVLKNDKTRKKIKIIDNEGDLEFDKITNMKGKPLNIKLSDIVITNFDVIKDELRKMEPPVVIYGGPVIEDYYIPIQPEDPQINIYE